MTTYGGGDLRLPAAVWPVAYYIRKESQALGWSERTFAKKFVAAHKMGRFGRGLLRPDHPLSDIAVTALAEVFGTSTQLWLNLDRAFWSSLASQLYMAIRSAGA